MRPEAVRTQALGNAHPLGKFRVIGPFSNLPDFAKAYQCPATAPMVRRPQCKIW
jgi:putative endopeptidase